ncbi:MAG: hydrogenase maturation peptidase HycI [Candidatus Aenigmatarchaeota archaeon]|nr:MAG: hydrogenase maturation peptidase HycI [Candidatus Aenigmarchaeota archaeon]
MNMKYKNMDKKIVVCGIGNRFRGDDGVGPALIDMLKKEIKKDNVLLLSCESAPENFAGKIEKFCPEKIIIIDTVDFGKKPGTIGIVDVNKIKNQNLSTHKLSLDIFIKYLSEKIDFDLIFIGVQPKNTDFSEEISKECKDSLKELKMRVLKEIINVKL